MRIDLLKRVQLWQTSRRDVVSCDTVIATADMQDDKEYAEGINLLRGVIQAGLEGRETSWRVEDVAEVQVTLLNLGSPSLSRTLRLCSQYIIRVLLCPPSCLVSHVPSFIHEEVVEIATDNWGLLERELMSTGGTPTPALGLASDLQSS
jgi:hypothetical protein